LRIFHTGKRGGTGLNRLNGVVGLVYPLSLINVEWVEKVLLVKSLKDVSQNTNFALIKGVATIV